MTLAFICLTWIFFRANSLEQAGNIITAIFSYSPNYLNIGQDGLISARYLGVAGWQLASCFILIAFLFTAEWFHKTHGLKTWLDQKPAYVRWGAYYALIVCLLLFGAFTTNEFIYFQF